MRNQKLSLFTALLMLALATAVPALTLGQLALDPVFPFSSGTADYLGPLNLTGRSGGLYDLQPTVMYEADDTAQPFKMWWHGQNPGVEPGDAIYFAHSLDGHNWSDPMLVLTPQLGTGGDEWADDHLVGAPTTIKVGNTYYMFYEAYTSWVTPINRFFNFAAGDTWTTHGTPQDDNVINVANDSWERALGVAWRFPKSYSASDVSHPIYGGEVIHSDGKRDRFLSRTPVVDQTDAFGSQFSPLYNGFPVFHLFDSDGGNRGRKPIYEFFDPVNRNTYVTDDGTGEGVAGTLFNELLGYAASDLDTIDMRHALQNQVMMATSTDGIHWTRFRGAGPGGSVASPEVAYTNLFNFNATSANGLPRHAFQGAVGSQYHWDIYRAYGSGFPAVLERDGKLELFFTDDSLETPPVPVVPQKMFPIPIDQIENPQAYLDAGPTRELVYYGQDVKWSPLFGLYFFTNFKADPANPNKWSPEVQWRHPDASGPNILGFDETFPTSNSAPRGGGQGGVAGTPLGHTLDFPDAAEPHTAFHLYYAASDPTFIENYHNKDLDHVLVFGYHFVPTPFDGVVTIDGIEVEDGDTIDFGNVVLGQPKTFDLVYNSRNSPNNYFVIASATTTGDFSDSIVFPMAARAGDAFDLTYEASALGATNGTITVTVNFVDQTPYTVTVNLIGNANLLGDVNLDGAIDFSDIPAFIAVLSSGMFQATADCDENGAVDFADIPSFIQILLAQ